MEYENRQSSIKVGRVRRVLVLSKFMLKGEKSTLAGSRLLIDVPIDENMA